MRYAHRNYQPMQASKYVDGVIPEQYQPSESEHVDYPEVYRFVKNVDFDSSSFQPYIVEHPSIKAKFVSNQVGKGIYGVSLFVSLSAARKAFFASGNIQKNTMGLAKGFTSISRGISTRANQEGHLDYFLYDYIGNSPAEDFVFEIKNQDL